MGKISILKCITRVWSNCKVFYQSGILDNNRETVFEDKTKGIFANKVDSLFEVVPKINQKLNEIRSGGFSLKKLAKYIKILDSFQILIFNKITYIC